MKRTLGILVCMLMIFPVISSSTATNLEPEFEIDYNSIYFVKMWFDITNVGDVDAIDVDWIIDTDINIRIPGLPPPWNGTIGNISVNETKRISTYGFLMSLGFYTIYIKLNATDIEETTFITKGFFFGPFVFIPKPL